MTASTGDIQRQLHQLFDAGGAVGLTDGELLERLAATDSASAEAAFETILARHGSTVLSVCRQVLGDVHAAEDAFQATFLVLVRRAGSLRIRENGSLGSWLYGVAYRIAMKARQGTAHRRVREHRTAVPEATPAQRPDAVAERNELGAVLHDEVNRLPAKYRVPLVLCYFEGRTTDEAAATLRWPAGTIRSNLSRARDLLRRRLIRRGLGVTPAVLVGAASVETLARAEMPAALRTATVATVIRGMPAAAVAALTKRMLRGLFLARLKAAAGVIAAMALLAAGVGFAAQGSRPGQQPGPGPASVAEDRPRPGPVDPPADTLPRYARARLGDLRFHHDGWVRQAVFTPDGRYRASGGRPAKSATAERPVDPRLRAGLGPGRRDAQRARGQDPGPRLLSRRPPAGRRQRDHPREDRSTIRIWDLATGRELRRLEGHRSAVNALAFTRDGRSLVSGSEDGTALIWDVSDLRDDVRSDEPVNPGSLQAHWNALADDNARAAFRATWALSVPSAAAFLGDRLEAAATARADHRARGPAPPRAIAALERIGTPEAGGALERVAHGHPDAPETREARSTLKRLRVQPEADPSE